MKESPQDKKALENLFDEKRSFKPSEEFARKANAADPKVWEKAAADPEKWWAERAEEFFWYKKWDKVLDESQAPFFKWFVNGKTNISVNCLDRHLTTWRRNKAAIIWEGEPGDERVLTYNDLHREVCKFTSVLRKMGIKKGDRVVIYMGMIPELAISMLACARIGAIHSVIFGGFSAESISDRVNDCQASLVITADGGYRRGNIVPLKRNVDEALKTCPTVKNVIMVNRVGSESMSHFMEGRDHFWNRLMQEAVQNCEPEQMDSEDMLYILYTSGTTGKPKGIMHTTGGYMVGTATTHKMIFDIKDEDIFWCTADIGWVTGHSYIVYGPLANGSTNIMYEGSPDWPDKDRFWKIIEKFRVNIFYTAPTAIRTFMRWGTEYVANRNLSSLRLLGSVGEPINPEAWMWYQEHIGRGKCPIVDTWWQTETGAIMITPLPGLTATKPGSATFPFPTITPDVVDENGQSVPLGGGGFLVLRRPWPSMLRGIWGDPDRYVKTYWSKFKGLYFAGDGAKRDEEGYYWLLGRVDDIMLIAGHNISTTEVESALVDHKDVAEAAVVGKKDDVTGEAIAAFVTLKTGIKGDENKIDELKAHVAKKIGPIARPKTLYFTADLPKTRSGKIMRRLLKDIAEGRVLGDTTTLADPTIVASIRQQYEEKEQ
jgi:acetyl-CoA synthetase